MRRGYAVLAFHLAGAVLLAAGARGQPAPPPDRPPAISLDRILVTTPTDSLAPVLRRHEQQARGREAAEVAFTLGQYHYARGEYRQAADAFSRAAARFEPARKPDARYWVGMCALAVRDAPQARAVLEEVAQSPGPRRAEASYGVALAWELSERPDRVHETLVRLLDGGAGETTPAALEKLAATAARLGRADEARRAFERLRREWPHSIEAARAPVVAARPAPPAVAPPRAFAVSLGSFADDARARTLAERARRAGFPSVQVQVRGAGSARTHMVRLGIYPSEAEARAAGQRAADALGTAYRVERLP
jgi:tetratricopeptide (TPR) repeat protein